MSTVSNWQSPANVDNSSATAERPRELGDFKAAGYFEAKF